jgi:hypothetical protein
MHLLHVNSESDAHEIDKLISHGKHVFIIVYMVGCGPCNATRPEWNKMGELMKKQYNHDKDLVIIDVNKDFMPFTKMIGEVDGFPTLKYIANNGQKIETYEDSDIRTKDRSSDSFVNWVESKLLTGKIVSVTPDSSVHHVFRRLSKTRRNNKSKNRNNKSKNRNNKSKNRNNKTKNRNNKSKNRNNKSKNRN